MADAYELVRRAILGKRQVVATYAGHRRAMCPHAIGTKGGLGQALFFQFAGGSNAGLAPGGGWRCLAIDRLSEIEVRDGEWHTAPDYNGPGSCIDAVDLAIDD